MADSFGDPFNIKVPSAVFKITKKNTGAQSQNKNSPDHGSYDFVKIMEDNGETLPGATVAVHDAETGRVFLGGVVSPYIVICETR